MTNPARPLSGEDITAQMAVADLKDIRHIALTNMAEEILKISDLVEDNIGDLSDEFIKLVEYSRQQADDMTTACDLLGHEKPDRGEAGKKKARAMLKESADGASRFHQNVNRMVYSMQFQDRTRQLMQAISAALNILTNLSETIENNQKSGRIKEKTAISEDNKTILNRMIEEADHRELDQNYILRMFMGVRQDTGETGRDNTQNFTDIELF